MTENLPASESPGPSEEFPTAEIEPAGWSIRTWFWRTWPIWAVAVGSIVVTVILVVVSIGSSGPRITVRFSEGYGIKPGDRLKHRGIEVGEVIAVELDTDLKGVLITMELTPAAEAIAREGSRFWIERPHISLSRISGLETVVGAKHVGVLPGPADGKQMFDFEGEESPPLFHDSDSVEITVHFQNGYGLAAGVVAKHRGIVIGEVTSVELDSKFHGVAVRVRLTGQATGLARAGSQFWVERPRLSLAEIRGLETLVGGRYLAVLPGPIDAEARRSFVGLESAPAGELPAGGLEILLQGSAKHGLEPGTPVMYRGHQVGQIVSVGLAHDSASVDARVFIQPDYRNLIRDNTRFWSNSGLHVRFGLSGVELGTDTLANLAQGGVTFATPTKPGELVTTGHRFSIADKADSDWLAWVPRIPVGTGFLRDGLAFPTPQRVTLRWTEKSFGFSRTKRKQGWVLAIDDGWHLLGPKDLLTPAADAVGETILEVSGHELVIGQEPAQMFNGLALYRVTGEAISSASAWDLKRLRTPSELESSMLVSDPQHAKLPLPTERLSKGEEGTWLVDPSVPLDTTWHGGCLISTKDGHLIGIVLTNKRPAEVVLVPKTIPLPDRD